MGLIVDVINCDSRVQSSQPLSNQAAKLLASERQVGVAFGKRSVMSEYVVGEGIEGLSIHKIKKYIPGRTPGGLSIRNFLGNSQLVSDVLEIFALSRRYFMKTGNLVDLGGGFVNHESDLMGKINAMFPIRSRNILVGAETGRAFLIDCNADPHMYNLTQAESIVRKIKIVCLVAANFVFELGLRAHLSLLRVKQAEKVSKLSFAPPLDS